jgi:hypothetical protein
MPHWPYLFNGSADAFKQGWVAQGSELDGGETLALL